MAALKIQEALDTDEKKILRARRKWSGLIFNDPYIEYLDAIDEVELLISVGASDEEISEAIHNGAVIRANLLEKCYEVTEGVHLSQIEDYDMDYVNEQVEAHRELMKYDDEDYNGGN